MVEDSPREYEVEGDEADYRTEDLIGNGLGVLADRALAFVGWPAENGVRLSR